MAKMKLLMPKILILIKIKFRKKIFQKIYVRSHSLTMNACIEEEEMGDERCEMGLENLVDEQNLEKNQCSVSSNTHENNNNTNTDTNTNNSNDKKQEFLQITRNIIHHFSANNHENVDQFLQISTPTTTSSSSATTPTNNNNIPSHFLSSATPIPLPPPTAAVAKNNTNTTTNQNFYAKGCGKNNVSSSTSTSPSTGNNNNNSNKEQDRFLPIANVGRIMKKFIPGNGKISKDAKETVQECVSEFISFVTGEASDKCQREKRKTINGDDIIWAITTLGFEDYVAPLKHYLNKYRELEGEKLNVPKQHQRNHNDHHHQKPNMPNYHCHNNVYSSSTSLPSFVPNDQPFPLPFPQTSNIQKRLPQHEHIDSVANW